MASNSVGFIGLGIMGKGMLKNLVNKLDSSLNYVVWNRSKDVAVEMQNQFPGRITIADTPASVIRHCEVTYSMLSTPEASESVFDLPEEGVIAGVSEGKVIVDCATLSPERMVAEAQAIQARGGRFLEAPVSGSKGPAETGQLIFLCGGDADLFEQVSPALDAMGKAKFLYGPVGQGSRVKLVINMMMGTMMTSLSEGLALCKVLNLPADPVLQAVDLSAIANPMFRMKGPLMLQGKHDPNFPLKHAQKDMRLALDMAREQGVALKTAAAANEIYVKALEQALGDEDFSAVYKAL